MTRRLWLDVETADYAREALSFPGLRILLRVGNDGEAAGQLVVGDLRVGHFADATEGAEESGQLRRGKDAAGFVVNADQSAADGKTHDSGAERGCAVGAPDLQTATPG